ncbi:MAG: Crp/Fnr family transcriptional regulator [Pseudomonadota bacterium]
MLVQKDLSRANRLISVVPAVGRGLFLEHSELIELRLNEVLARRGDPIAYAYFPIEGFISQGLPTADATLSEVGLVGSEGMVNSSLVLGVPRASFTCVVQGAGRAFRMQREHFNRLVAQDAQLRDVLNRYIEVRQVQLAQQSVCMNQHSVEQRLARWLLMTRDRAHSSELFLTHEVLSVMLGVRRESVTQSARSFHNRGLISYSRGYVMLHDEPGLQRLACGCYDGDLSVYANLLPHEYAAGH